MRDGENIREVEQLDVDWMGFIFYPKSPRYIGEKPEYLPANVKRVGVFVNELLDIVLERATQNQLQILQLHGDESPEYCKALREKSFLVMKSFGIAADQPFPSARVRTYEGVCDYFLFDAKTPLHGGAGKKFDWDILSNYSGKIPFLLSGGISPEDVKAVKSFSHPQYIGIDVNSGFETAPALKDKQLVKTFIERIRQT